jgi:hypothetical protein
MAARKERGKGVPLTDEERQARHRELYGSEELTPRGTGLSNPGGTDWLPWILIIIGVYLLVKK